MRRRGARDRSARTIAIFIVAAMLFAGGGALACGYHNPSDIARGTLNYIYPKSLYVRTAVWQAQNSGLLPPRPARAVKDLFAYQRIADGLQQLGDALALPPAPRFGFTVILLDSMLWSRYAPGESGFDVDVHVKGSKKGDAVLVTQSEVILALNAGNLGFDVAEAQGLIRLYGPVDRQEAVRSVLRGLPVDARADPPQGAEGASG